MTCLYISQPLEVSETDRPDKTITPAQRDGSAVMAKPNACSQPRAGEKSAGEEEYVTWGKVHHTLSLRRRLGGVQSSRGF